MAKLRVSYFLAWLLIARFGGSFSFCKCQNKALFLYENVFRVHSNKTYFQTRNIVPRLVLKRTKGNSEISYSETWSLQNVM